MIPEPTGDEAVYLFLDELATDGIITLNGVVKPYSRLFIRQKLEEAEAWEAGLEALLSDVPADGQPASAGADVHKAI